MFASQDVFGIEPDIIVAPRGLTSGYQPLGACIFSDAIHEAISCRPRRLVSPTATYSPPPIACAAGSPISP
jgi:adenosylmethionine-8-amino-7-oxononanoate aminotransferase